MAYKYETKNCRNCEHCVKTDKGLYCAHREGNPKVTGGGWCIDRQEKDKNNDMLPVGTTVHINPEDIKWSGGDLISRSASKKAIYVEFGNSNLADAFNDIIDNVPTVEPFEPDYVGAERLAARQRGYADGYHNGMEIGKTLNPRIKQGEWIDYSEEGFIECPFCHKATNCEDNIDELHYCWNCGAELKKGGAE